MPYLTKQLTTILSSNYYFTLFLFKVSQKTMHKYEQESRKLGKQSFVYAWVLDETGEERTRGITMDVGRFQFETKTKMVDSLQFFYCFFRINAIFR